MSAGPTPRTIAVVSQVSAGHIPTYHAMLVDAFAAQGCRVISLAPWAVTLPAEAVSRTVFHLDWRGLASVSGAAAPTRAGVLRAGWAGRFWRWIGLGARRVARRRWRATATALGDIERETAWRPDLVVLVFLGMEYLEPGVTGGDIDRWMPYSWAGIWNGPSWADGSARATLAALFRPKHGALASQRCRFILTPDRRLLPPQPEKWPHVSFRVFPEIADLTAPAGDDSLAREMLENAAGRPVIALLGNVVERKGVHLFLESARRAAAAGHDWRFVLAGDFSESACGRDEYTRLKAGLASAPANCWLHLSRVVDGASFNALVAASSVIFVVYDRFPFNSNLLTKAASFGKPVVATEGMVIGGLVREYELGETVSPGDPEACVAAIGRLLREPRGTGRRAEFLMENSIPRLHSLVKEMLAAL